MNRKVFQNEFADWNQNAKFYKQEIGSPFRKILLAEMAHKFLLVGGPQKILDLGAGSGDFADFLTKKLEVKVTCLDFSPAMRAVAKKKFPKLEYLTASTMKLPFEDSSFEVVIASGLLHHLKAQEILEKSLREIKRVLKPGGHFCYLDRSDTKIASLAEHIFAFLKKIFSKIMGQYSGCSTTSEKLLAKDDLQLIRSYFKPLSRQPAYCLPFKSLLVTSYFLLYVFGRGPFIFFQRIFSPLASLFEKHFNTTIWETEFCEVLQKPQE